MGTLGIGLAVVMEVERGRRGAMIVGRDGGSKEQRKTRPWRHFILQASTRSEWASSLPTTCSCSSTTSHDHLSLSARVFRVLREATGMSVRVFLYKAAPEALNLIRSIVSSHPTPLKTQDLYNLALKQPVDGTVNHILRPDKADPKDGPLPPHPNHPIRSLR